MAKVFIGAGHGGSDPGAVANGLKEKDLALSIALACRDELARHGVSVRMSREKDDSESLTEKISECNSFAPDLALDIHINAGGGDGAEVFHSVAGGKGKTLAQNILDAIKAIGQQSRGAKTKRNSKGTDYFGFIRQTSAPAVIVECAFIDNKADVAIIDTAAEQKTMGAAIAKGVLKTLGIAWVAQTAQPAKPSEKSSNPASDWTGYVKSVQGAVGSAVDGIAGKRTLAACPTLRRGSKHKALIAVQNRLNYIGHACGDADGIFGAKTESAVKAFQQANGLPADGIIGQQTWKKLLGMK